MIMLQSHVTVTGTDLNMLCLKSLMQVLSSLQGTQASYKEVGLVDAT